MSPSPAMTEYIVKSGDSLSSIARRFLGSAGKWSVLADANRLANPDRLRVGQKLVIPSTNPVEVPPVANPARPPEPAANETVTFSVEGRRVFAINPATGERIQLGVRHRLGLYRQGLLQPEEFIAARPDDLQGLSLSRSERNVMLATAENEGNLDAVNTWDNSFLSFGMFQWTSGTDRTAGELPALLAVLRDRFPETFEHYWGQFGLGVVAENATTGWFTLGGRRLLAANSKEALRDHAWVYRFVRAAADRHVQAVEVLHAIHRLDGFYFTPRPRLGGLPLSGLLSSELGAALLLDHHVNRPGYVVGTVAQALEESGVSASRLADGDDALERRVLERYLKIRESYGRTPMTNARVRAEVTRRYVSDGVISEARGSFRSNRAQRAQGDVRP